MKKFLICLLMFFTTSTVFGGNVTIKDKEVLRKMFGTNLKMKMNPLNAASSCSPDDASNYVEDKCGDTVILPCNSAQDWIDCAVKELYKKCDYSYVKLLCSEVNAANYDPACKNLTCSASSFFISGIIGTFIMLKLFL